MLSDQHHRNNATKQLTSAIYNADNVWTGNPANWNRAVDYTYSADTLNRQSMNDNGVVTNYAPSALNQYQSLAGTIYNYDNNFNLREAPNWGGVFDAQSRLTVAAHGGGVAYLTYDGLGRCVRRVVNPPGAAARTLLFTYDGWKPVVEWDEAGNCQAWNIYGSGPDEILWRYQAEVANLRYHHDVHGNVAFLLDWNGNVVEKYTYDAFGKPTITDWYGNPHVNAGNEPQSWYGNRFMFQGREYIPELAIYDYRHRYYDPGLGRFLQTDPSGFGAGDMNLFRYCDDDPVDHTDPTGLVEQDTNSSIWHRAVYFDSASNFGGSLYDLDQQLRQPAGVGDRGGNEYGGGGGADGFGVGGTNFNKQNLADIRAGIAGAANEEAEKQSTDWSPSVQRGNFPPKKNKCELFVAEMAERGGAFVPRMKGHLLGYPPNAGDWGDPNVKIFGWKIVGTPQPGDVAAIKYVTRDNATGHCGIYVGNGQTVSAASNPAMVVRNPWGFRSGECPLFRRFVGYPPGE